MAEKKFPLFTQNHAETEKEDEVHLKPILGVKPGQYLALLYGAVLLLVLFFLLVFPGLVKPGSLAVVNSEPVGAAFRVDGVYRGTTPCRVFVPAGVRSLELVLPGFTPERLEKTFPASRFASLIFPRRVDVDLTLSCPDPAAAFAAAAAEYGRWSFGGEPTAAWQIPLSLSEGAYRTGPSFVAEGREEAGEILKAAARFATTRAALRDLLRAKQLADNGGLSPSPLTLLRSAEETLDYLAENGGAAIWLASLLPKETGAEIAASTWYEQGEAALRAAPTTDRAADGEAPPVPDIAGTRFILGLDFAIGQRPVNAAEYRAFIEANGEWAGENRQVLIEKGLVNDDYLDTPVRDDEPVRAVSWYAAAAYCAWLTGSAGLPPGWEIRLPSIEEWEAAALVSPAEWEWSRDGYAPLGFLPAGSPLVSSPERLLLGPRDGLYASLPPDLCSPFAAFRPVIARKER